MGRRFLGALVLALAMAVLWAGLASADGFIIVNPPPSPPKPLPTNFQPLSIRYHRVRVEIQDQVATTHIDQVFFNDSPYELEGTYIFPLPAGAAIDNFAMYVGGERLEGRLLKREEARRIYEEIVAQRRDPALLEYVGRDAFQARVFPIPAHGEKRIELTYRQVLPLEGGLASYLYPLNTERFSARPLEEASIVVHISSKTGLKAIYSPSHEVKVQREGDHAATVNWKAYRVKPDKDFVLYYGLSESEFGLNLLSYREEGQDGFFLLLVSPRVEVERAQVAAKDVVFVLDTSGSMGGEKIEQAKGAARFILDNLNPEDRFNIIAFNSSTQAYAQELRPAKEKEEAARFVESLKASGSTDIGRALLEAVAMADKARPTILIFLTDGLPTLGMRDPGEIIPRVGQAAPPSVRLFTFGVGNDVNTALLDGLAREMRGMSTYVRPGEDIEEKVSEFYAKVTAPLLTDISLDFRGVRVSQTYPYPLPDLFLGGQLVLIGRYEQGGKATITLKGQVSGQERRLVYEGVDFRERGGEEFIPRLWAARRIGYLLPQIRTQREDKELVQEVVELSLRYGIMTPYTSYLVEEDREIFSPQGQRVMVERVAEKLASAPTVGAQAVESSVGEESLRRAEQIESTHAKVAHVGTKTFLLKDGVWTDAAYQPGMRMATVNFGSQRYYELLSRHPEWGRYLSLGTRVIWVADGLAYEVKEGEGPESFPEVATPTPEPTPQPTPTPVPQSEAAGLWERIWLLVRSLLGRVQREVA